MLKRLLTILIFMNTTLFAQVEGGITVPYVDFPMKEGKGMYSTRGKCNMCHSWGYTLNQGKQSKKFWRKKVVKMIVTFKAPIESQYVDEVVNYLFENYGNGKLE